MKKSNKITPLEDYISIESDIRAAIKQACETHNVSQHKIGKLAGIHPIQINWFMKGEKTLALPTVAKIAKAVKELENDRVSKEVERITKAPK